VIILIRSGNQKRQAKAYSRSRNWRKAGLDQKH